MRMNRDSEDKCNAILNGTVITNVSGIILNLTCFMGHKLSGSVRDVAVVTLAAVTLQKLW